MDIERYDIKYIHKSGDEPVTIYITAKVEYKEDGTKMISYYHPITGKYVYEKSRL